MILVTGAFGFIGAHAARALIDAGEDVIATRFRTSALPDFLTPHLGARLSVEPLDLTSPHDVIDVVRRQKIDSVVHLASPAIGALTSAEDYRQQTQA
jgi:UDP-glucose 4-epimerase